jgi:hypothetical protein
LTVVDWRLLPSVLPCLIVNLLNSVLDHSVADREAPEAAVLVLAKNLLRVLLGIQS